MKNALTLLGGLLFGFGLALSGMTNPAKVIGFLDVAGAWDPTLAFVMAGAVASYGVALFLARRQGRGAGWCGTSLPEAGKPEYSGRLFGGAAIFGIGWGLGGFCPGPALADLGALRVEAFVFVPAMALGMLAAQRLFRADAS